MDDDILYRDYFIMYHDSVLLDMRDKLNNLFINN